MAKNGVLLVCAMAIRGQDMLTAPSVNVKNVVGLFALGLAQQRMKRKADPKRRDITFMIGQQVLLNAKNITLLGATASDNLMPRFIGPFKITKRVNEVAYELDLPKYLEIHPVFHVSLLKPYYDSGRIQPPPPPVNVMEGQLGYAVSRIVSHKACHKGRVPKWTYLIQWAVPSTIRGSTSHH
jgi:hypothetical protein